MFLGIATKRTNRRFLIPVHRASAPIEPQIVQTMRGPRDAFDFSAPVTAPL
jgi:hypothetical protein